MKAPTDIEERPPSYPDEIKAINICSRCWEAQKVTFVTVGNSVMVNCQKFCFPCFHKAFPEETIDGSLPRGAEEDTLGDARGEEKKDSEGTREDSKKEETGKEKSITQRG